MNTSKLKKLTNVLIVSAGILAVDMLPSFAQGNQSGAQESTVKKNKQGASHQQSDKAQNSMNSAMGSGFVNEAAESNLAEIELSQLALQNASAQEVKDYAQQMIEHHTMAQQELASIASGNMSMHKNHSGNMSDKKSNSADDANTDDKNTSDKANSSDNASGAGNTSGGTTGTGSTYSSGNASGAAGTQGSTAGAGNTTNTNTVGTTDGTKAGVGTGSNYKSSNTGGGGAGANAGGTTSSTNAGVGSDPRKSENASTTTSGNTSQESNTADSKVNDNSSASGNMNNSSAMSADLPVELSAEHKAIKSKLSGLTGAEFDRQYIQAMVKDHAKAVALFEKQSKNSEDAAIQAYAAKTLPVIKQHYQMAQKLSGTQNSGAKSSSKSGR